MGGFGAGRDHPGNHARVAAVIGCHRGELLRALGDLADGAWDGTMNYSITHRTLYEYAAPVTVSHHVARLEPRVTNVQGCEKFSLTVFPEPALRKERTDYFGNRLCFFAIQEMHSKLEIVTHSRVSVGVPKNAVP